jgi:hypothetical protein
MTRNGTTTTAGARTQYDWSNGGQFCSCGQDTVTCQGYGKLTCGDVAIQKEGKGNIGPCCFAKFNLGHSGPARKVSGGLPVFSFQEEMVEFLERRGFKSAHDGRPNCFDQESKDGSGSARVAFPEENVIDIYRFTPSGCIEWDVRGISFTAIPRDMVEAIINQTVGSLQ